MSLIWLEKVSNITLPQTCYIVWNKSVYLFIHISILRHLFQFLSSNDYVPIILLNVDKSRSIVCVCGGGG